MAGPSSAPRQLVIGLPAWMHYSQLLDCFKRCSIALAERQVRFRCDRVERLVADLNAGTIDLAYLCNTIDPPCVPVVQWMEEMCWVKSPNLVLAPGAPVPPILPPVDGFLLLDRAKFPASFAADVSPEKAEFMADSQVPWGVNAVGGTISEAAWKTKPTWYLLTTEDRMLPPDAQRLMSKRAGAKVVEVKSSHAVYLSHPQAVAQVIEEAARGALVAAKEGTTSAAD